MEVESKLHMSKITSCGFANIVCTLVAQLKRWSSIVPRTAETLVFNCTWRSCSSASLLLASSAANTPLLLARFAANSSVVVFVSSHACNSTMTNTDNYPAQLRRSYSGTCVSEGAIRKGHLPISLVTTGVSFNVQAN